MAGPIASGPAVRIAREDAIGEVLLRTVDARLGSQESADYEISQ